MELVKLLFINVVTASVAFAAFKDVCLSSHNKLRALHSSTPSLQWDAELATEAQAWADRLKNTKVIHHDSNRGTDVGENLYHAKGPAEASCANAVFEWYKEIKSYDYNSTSFSNATANFTQIVWKSTTKVGAGIAIDYNYGINVITYIVARYKPAGNVKGAFEANVMARKPGAKTPSIYTLDPSLCRDAGWNSLCAAGIIWGLCNSTHYFYSHMESYCAKTCKFC